MQAMIAPLPDPKRGFKCDALPRALLGVQACRLLWGVCLWALVAMLHRATQADTPTGWHDAPSQALPEDGYTVYACGTHSILSVAGCMVCAAFSPARGECIYVTCNL